MADNFSKKLRGKLSVSDDAYWSHEAKAILRAELERRAVTYDRLAQLLQAQGFQETTRSIANKVSRGSFSFVFFLQVMRVLGVQQVAMTPTQKVDGVLFSGEPVGSKS
ncbi:DUF6471 domain-containing protein [Azonexus sp. IMCC34839]|uniref:DUF6471 domain-containing protein n=1 Tax=Azonexus sp. IMCC34839 TaxID=3133695 RepID=UPI00399B1B00